MKYFIIALLFPLFTNYVNANPAFSINTTAPHTLVNNLEPENTYEARVKGLFSEGEGPWSNVVAITTPAKPVIVCG